MEKLLSELTYELELSPEGKLRVSNDRGNPRYFHIMEPKDTHGRYIIQEEMNLVYQLAQKDYVQKLYTKVLKELDDMFIKQWEGEECKTNPYFPEEKVYVTKRGDYVRSKSEVLLADMYFNLGIPYRYEAQLCLKSGKKKYPDFTLLKTVTREVIYHEHMGLMDDNEYRHANLVKLDEYRRNGKKYFFPP